MMAKLRWVRTGPYSYDLKRGRSVVGSVHRQAYWDESTGRPWTWLGPGGSASENGHATSEDAQSSLLQSLAVEAA